MPYDFMTFVDAHMAGTHSYEHLSTGSSVKYRKTATFCDFSLVCFGAHFSLK